MGNEIKKALIVSMALIIAALILGGFFYQAQKPQHTIRVVGIASRKFEADTVKWSINLEAEAGPGQLKDGYEKLNRQIETLEGFLAGIGISSENINRKPVNIFKQYQHIEKNGLRERIFTGYRLNQNFYIITNEIEEIENLAYNPVPLMDKGVIISQSRLQYYSSNIDELKKEIIAEATANARARAEKMVENTNVKVGKTLSLSSGVFQITEPYSTRVSSSGIYDTSTRKKQIRVTVHAVFALK